MVIYFYSNEYNGLFCEIFASRLRTLGHTCVVHKTFNDLYITMKSLKTYPDLLVLDYLTYNHNSYDITKDFKNHNIPTPVIFFNDPNLIMRKRTYYWMRHTKFVLRNRLDYLLEKDPQLLEKYRQIFDEIHEMVTSEELSPYIYLMQLPKQLPQDFSIDNIYKSFFKAQKPLYQKIDKFKDSVKLPKNLFHILKVLDQNSEKEMTLKEICSIYNESTGHNLTEESLKIQISKLRKYFKEDALCRYSITRKGDKYTFSKNEEKD